jgi:hypothetical protein
VAVVAAFAREFHVHSICSWRTTCRLSGTAGDLSAVAFWNSRELMQNSAWTVRLRTEVAGDATPVLLVLDQRWASIPRSVHSHVQLVRSLMRIVKIMVTLNDISMGEWWSWGREDRCEQEILEIFVRSVNMFIGLRSRGELSARKGKRVQPKRSQE